MAAGKLQGNWISGWKSWWYYLFFSNGL